MQNHQVSKTHYKVSDFITWAKGSTLILSPSFQRRSVWPPGARSYLIDTIIRGLPIPILFLRERKTDLDSLEAKREVVDGQQRIRTLLNFIQPGLLKGFDAEKDGFTIKKTHNKDLAGKPFKDLPGSVRQSILDYQFSVHILPSSVDDRQVLQIFARMNSTGLKLNPQELRNAAFFGEFKTSMYAIAAEQLSRWRGWEIFSESQISRMAEVELSSEFVQYMVKGLVGKTQKAINVVYDDFDETWDERGEAERRFRHCFDAIDDAIGTDLKNSAFKNRAAFFGLFSVVYDAAFEAKSPLNKKKPAASLPATFKTGVFKCSDAIQKNKAPESVLDSLAYGTAHIDSRKVFNEYLRQRLLGA